MKHLTKLKGLYLSQLFLLLCLAGLLAACGGGETLSLPTPQNQAGIVPVVEATPSPASGDQTATPGIVSMPGSPSATAQPPTSTPTNAEPTATAGDEVGITIPARLPRPTITALPRSPRPTATAAPRTASPTSTPEDSDDNDTTPATAKPTLTPRPTPDLTPVPLDAEAELKVIKAAYDALVQHYYTTLDTGPIAQKSLDVIARYLNLQAPTGLQWQTDPAANWQIFEEQYRALTEQASFQLPKGALAQYVVYTMAQTVGDLHTYYLDEVRSEAVTRMGRGDNSTVGFGVYFIYYQNSYYVQRLVTNGPAQKAGVLVGDRVVAVNDQPLDQTTVYDLYEPTENKSYKFELARPGQVQSVMADITAQRYIIPTAEWRVVAGHIGLITLNAFQLDVATRLDEAVADLRKQGADSLVIDLRFNGGGYNFDLVSGRFVKDGTTLGSFTNRQGTIPIKARSQGKQVDPSLPLVVLIDRNSASASEIFSLAVQENGAGQIIGGKSAGAIGTVRYWPLGDGTMLGVTASVYTTAKGQKLNGKGVTPDQIVQRSTADLLAGRDPQLDAAVKYIEQKKKS